MTNCEYISLDLRKLNRYLPFCLLPLFPINHSEYIWVCVYVHVYVILVIWALSINHCNRLNWMYMKRKTVSLRKWIVLWRLNLKRSTYTYTYILYIAIHVSVYSIFGFYLTLKYESTVKSYIIKICHSVSKISKNYRAGPKNIVQWSRHTLIKLAER